MAEDPDQHRDKRQRLEPHEAETGEAMDVDSSLLPTNHERSAQVKKEEAPTPNVLKVEQEQEQDQIAETLEQLHKDMGEPFLLCRSSKALYVQSFFAVHAY